MRIKGNISAQLWIIYGLFFFISVLANISSAMQLYVRLKTLNFFVKHISFYLGSFIIILLLMQAREKGINLLYKIAPLIAKIGVIFAILTVMFGYRANLSTRSLSLLGLTTINSFEIIKLIIVIYLARKLSEQNILEENKIDKLKKDFILIALMLIPIAFNNLSTFLLIVLIILILLWLAGFSMKMMKTVAKYVVIGLSFLVLIIIIKPSFIKRASTWTNRINKFITNSYNPNDQAFLAKTAIASTSFFHIMPGKGQSKYYLPLSYTDYIYAIIAEEIPILAAILIIIYLWFLILVRKISLRLKKPFYIFLVMGFGIFISLQAFMHIAVNLGLIPETGQTLPFISLGGTSLLINSIMFGVIITIHKITLENKQEDLDTNEVDNSDFKDDDLNEEYEPIII